jgi:hypothetical protein
VAWEEYCRSPGNVALEECWRSPGLGPWRLTLLSFRDRRPASIPPTSADFADRYAAALTKPLGEEVTYGPSPTASSPETEYSAIIFVQLK